MGFATMRFSSRNSAFYASKKPYLTMLNRRVTTRKPRSGKKRLRKQGNELRKLQVPIPPFRASLPLFSTLQNLSGTQFCTLAHTVQRTKLTHAHIV